ncbi:hypothetical protein JCM21714_3616 [Gracilibacillus boraciitolerans JCM 21714]|uniref:Uncharacterized protein n=1 Tax=Gracilibacillus boraciitolerans JCM 21714 TaxID=1298598 RepID=W4VNR1_9BACI|nr:sodium:solute symporter family protein [Gracilibacillus boraciitolerans]GAE94458.1 hypothetical protein JCM21714_3616 [Gracilibacillus boraciitolerans JCM 21714]
MDRFIDFFQTFWRYGKFGRVSTVPEWLGRRYNSKALQVIVSVLILFNVYYIVGQNVGLATIFETVIGIPYVWGIIIGVTITILYIGLGGAFAQMITDGIQGLLMAIASILIFVSFFWTIGGGINVFGELTSQLNAVDPNLTKAIGGVEGPYNSVLAIMAVQFLLFSFILMPHLLNKILSIETEEELAPFTLSTGVVLFVISTLMVLGGLAARVLFPALDSADAAIPMYVIESFPTIISAIIIVGIISAILSSTDSLYLGVTTSIGNDSYRILAPLFKKDLTKEQIDSQSLKVAKGSLIVVGLLSLYISLDRPESLSILIQFSFSAILSGILAPIALGYFWKKATNYGAIAAVITGAGLYVAFTQLNLIENIYLAMFFASLASFVVMGIVGLLTATEKHEELVLKKTV